MRKAAYLISVALWSCSAGAALADIPASAALAMAEKICMLPKGASLFNWFVLPADEAAPPIPSQPAPQGRYWVVTVNYNVGPDRDSMRIGIAKDGTSTPNSCELLRLRGYNAVK